MTVGMDDGKFILKDNWPDNNVMVAAPSDMTAEYATAYGSGATTDAPCPVGTKVRIYQTTNKGFATFILLQYNKGTAALAAIKSACAPETTAAAAAGGYHGVTNDGGEALKDTGLVAVALATLADTYYYWFWCGGVCPVDTVAGLDGIHPSDGSVTAGCVLTLVDSASYCKFGLLAMNDASAMYAPAGMAFAVDTTS